MGIFYIWLKGAEPLRGFLCVNVGYSECWLADVNDGEIGCKAKSFKFFKF